MNSFEIRKAEEQDLFDLVQLCREHAAYEESNYLAAGKEFLLQKYLFSDKPAFECLVVDGNNGLVGFVTYMKQFSTWDASFYVYMDCLYLKAEARGNGIGTELIDRVKQYANEQNCIQIQWQTPVNNQLAILFYEHIGATALDKKRFFLNDPD